MSTTKQDKPAEAPVAGAEFEPGRDEHATSAEFEGSAEGRNEAIDQHDQGVAVEIKSGFGHQVTDDGVVILPDEAEGKTPGGLIIPDAAKKRIQTGVVLALGPGKTHENGFVKKPSCKVGQRVLYGRYAGEQIELKHRGRDVILMRQHDIRLVMGI